MEATVTKVDSVLSCPVCSQKHQAVSFASSTTVSCARCGSVIFRGESKSVSQTLAFSIAALILYIPANIYPILSMEKLGVYSENTIWQGVWELFHNGYWGISILVFLASILIPLLKLLVMIYLSLARHYGGRQKLKLGLFRLVKHLGPWSMLDVFLVAILVSLVKLGNLATVHPESGLTAFAAVVVLTLFASASFEVSVLWKKDDG
jgi:paraquat-inducible protein A